MIVGGHAYELESRDRKMVNSKEVHCLRSSQEETDTRVVLYAKYGASKSYTNIGVKSPDTDIFFVLLHFANQIDSKMLFDTGTGNHKRLINITDFANNFG